MLKKFTSPYRFAPAVISTGRIDDLIAQGAVAEVQGSGQRKLNSVDLVTFTVDGRIMDQFTVHGHVSSTMKFVAEFNKAVREARR